MLTKTRPGSEQLYSAVEHSTAIQFPILVCFLFGPFRVCALQKGSQVKGIVQLYIVVVYKSIADLYTNC